MDAVKWSGFSGVFRSLHASHPQLKSGKNFPMKFLWMLLGRWNISPLLSVWDWWLQKNIWTAEMCHTTVFSATKFLNYIFEVYRTLSTQKSSVTFNANRSNLCISVIITEVKNRFMLFFQTRGQYLIQPGHNILCFSFQT